MTNDNFEDAIRTRIQDGFDNWNNGYEAWLEWCDILYEPDAHYNIQGSHGHGMEGGMVRLTLQEYKDMMGQFFEGFDLELGEFYNMLVQDDWCAIRYNVFVTNKQTGNKVENMTMEFVNWKDNPGPIGARVIEGWALSDQPLA
jgi:hypothetical protein